jgi:hypothetical protein
MPMDLVWESQHANFLPVGQPGNLLAAPTALFKNALGNFVCKGGPRLLLRRKTTSFGTFFEHLTLENCEATPGEPVRIGPFWTVIDCQVHAKLEFFG